MVGRLEWVQGLRAFAVLLVLFSHLFRIEEKYATQTVLSDFVLAGVSGVDLFFVISGFIMVVVTEKSRAGLRRAAQFIYRRLLRIYPVYWFYTSLVLVVYLLKPAMVNSGVPSSIWGSYLLWPTGDPFLVAVGWTLSHEIYFYLVFMGLFFLPRTLMVPALLGWGLLVLLVGALYAGSTPWMQLILSPMTFEFIAGALLAIGCMRGLPRWPLRFSLGVMTLAILAMFALGSAYLAATGHTPSGWHRVLLFGPPSVILLYAVLLAERAGGVLPRWVVAAGDASYSTYLTHVLVLSVLGYLWVWGARYLAISSFAMLPVMVIACFIYGWISYSLLEKSVLRAGKRLING